MTQRLRKLVLTTHITFSVGWLGAVAVFIVLAITGLTTMNNQLSRSALLAMDLSAWFVIVPFCLTSLFTGLVQAFGTKWGLFKHYWIVVKLFLTTFMTILLLLHMQPISYLANVATDTSFSNSQYAGQLLDIITKAGAAILVLIAITTISVYKPWGKIQRTQTINSNQPYLQYGTEKSKKIVDILSAYRVRNFSFIYHHQTFIWWWYAWTLITRTIENLPLTTYRLALWRLDAKPMNICNYILL